MNANEKIPDDPPGDGEKKIFVAGQWQLFWWKFKRHRLALFSLAVTLFLYFLALTAEFVAPFDPNAEKTRYTYGPMQRLSLFDEGSFRPHVLGLVSRVDPIAARRTFEVDPSVKIPLGVWVRTAPYKLMGFIPMEHRLFGPVDQAQPMYLLGADRLGRDMLSRVIHGARVSLSIGLVGVAMSLFLGILLGGMSGYYGGMADTIIQRVIEFLRSIPTIPLWMGLAAAVPLTWPPLRTYFIITLIVSLLGWTSLAREVRGKFLSLRNEDFIIAARLDGMSEIGIIFRHMVPSFLSHIIANLTLSIPAMILAETSLSFLGIGLQPPIVSWGVLLQEAQNIRALSQAPWLLFVPGAAVVTSVLSLNFLGDGLRDAADPYSR